MSRINLFGAPLTQQRVAFALACLLVFLVTLFTLMPPKTIPSVPGSDKLHHFLAFGAVAFALTLSKPRAFVWIVLLVATYGGMIEIAQPYVGRERDLSDAIANATGAFCGSVLGVALHMFSARRLEKLAAMAPDSLQVPPIKSTLTRPNS